MMDVKTDGTTVWFGERFSLTFQRTLRIPDDGMTYPLPPGLGYFPINHVADFKKKVPSEWVRHGGVFIPMYQREALWISFNGAYWKPNAVKIGIGKINAVSGKSWTQVILKRKQDYLVCPPQPWLDGINVGKGYIRQFVAMPLGQGYTVEGQLSGKEEWGGVQVMVFEPKPGKFPDQPTIEYYEPCMFPCSPKPTGMGICAGGKMKQEIYPDPHGFDTWDTENYGRLFVHIVNSEMYREITGMAPPQTPINAKVYTNCGLPWFDLYGGELGDLSGAKEFAKVKTVKETDQEKGLEGAQDDTPVDIPPEDVLNLFTSNIKSNVRRVIDQSRNK